MTSSVCVESVRVETTRSASFVVTMDPSLFKLQTPFKLAMFGASGSGKSFLISEILQHFSTITKPPERLSGGKRSVHNLGVLYCYKSRMPDNLSTPVKQYRGLPNVDDILDCKYKHGYDGIVLVLDDLMLDLKHIRPGTQLYRGYESLFIDVARTENINIICTFQNLFPQCPLALLFIRNSTGQIIFNFNADLGSVHRKASMLFPGDKDVFLEAYKHAKNLKPGGYLFIDTHPRSTLLDSYRLRNFIAPIPNKQSSNHHTKAVSHHHLNYIYPNDKDAEKMHSSESTFTSFKNANSASKKDSRLTHSDERGVGHTDGLSPLPEGVQRYTSKPRSSW